MIKKIGVVGPLVLLALFGIVVAISGSKALDFSAGEWLFAAGVCVFICWIVGGFVVDSWKDE